MCPLTSCGRFQNGSTEDVPVVIGTISVAYYLRPLSSSPSRGPFHEKARGLSPLAFSSSGFWEEMRSEDARIMTLRSSHSLAHFRPSACQPSPPVCLPGTSTAPSSTCNWVYHGQWHCCPTMCHNCIFFYRFIFFPACF